MQSSSNAVPRPLRNDYTVTISVLQMTARDLGWETDALMGHWSGPGEPSNGDVVRIPFWVSHVLHLSWCRSPSNLSPRQKKTIIAASQIWGQGAMRGVLTCLTRVCSNKRCAQQSSTSTFPPCPISTSHWHSPSRPRTLIFLLH